MAQQAMNRVTRILDHYFAEPRENRPANQPLSVLYLLRRDAAQCLGYDPNTYTIASQPLEDGRQVLWPGVMAVFAGIDLLSKFHAGTDEDQIPPGTVQADHWRYSVTGRFIAFINAYFNLNQQESEMIYQLRNSLDHSFALWSRRRRDGQVFRFTLGRQAEAQANRLMDFRNDANGELECIVYLYELHRRFEQVVAQFQPDLRRRVEQTPADQQAFETLVERYGFIGIAHASAFGW